MSPLRAEELEPVDVAERRHERKFVSRHHSDLEPPAPGDQRQRGCVPVATAVPGLLFW